MRGIVRSGNDGKSEVQPDESSVNVQRVTEEHGEEVTIELLWIDLACFAAQLNSSDQQGRK